MLLFQIRFTTTTFFAENKTLVFFILFGVIVLGALAYLVLRSPFDYPYFIRRINVSGKRLPTIQDSLDSFLIEDRFVSIERHKKQIEEWKKNCEMFVSHSRLSNLRRKQYLEAIDDECAYEFILYREQTRYRQSNYIKNAYKTEVEVDRGSFSYKDLYDRNKRLATINYESNLHTYYSKNQRNLMTKALREQIMKRDNYTCQICGKYMPDRVGLQIDHIIPVSAGGKSVPSNLQVLCSRCNGRKSAKL